MNLFKSKSKSPADTIKQARETMHVFEKHGASSKSIEKAAEEMTKLFTQMKHYIYGEPGQEPNPEHVNALLNAIASEELVPLIIKHMARFDFEARKDAVTVFNNALRRQVNNKSVTVDFLASRPVLLTLMIKGYENPDVATNCGTMIRECARYEPLAKAMLHSDEFYNFFGYVEQANFDIASDAFSTLKELLTKHKTLCAEFLERNYTKLFDKYALLLSSGNYVTRRQSLKLLGELLLDRANFAIMTKYISSDDNLKLMMMMLRDKSRSIQFEAFHVFKVFVANPNKTPAILDILQNNKEKLISFLNNFHNDKEDEQFNEEKAFLLKQIAAL